MNCTKELDFLSEVYRRNGIHTRVLSQTELAQRISSGELFFGIDTDGEKFISMILPRVLYRVTDALECHYKLLLLSDGGEKSLLVVGPYRGEVPSEEHLLEIAEHIGLPPKSMRGLSAYYESVGRLNEQSPLMTALSVFCERIFGTPSYSLEELGVGDISRVDVPMTKTLSDASVSDTMLDMRAMEERYAYENKMMRVVELGMLQEGNALLKAFDGKLFEARTSDSLRNAKNYCIIMNTLLRKAAERGGVHPIYLDRVSSGFALKIEDGESVSELVSLMAEMLDSYLRLVRKHSFKSYSPTVQRVILAIEADLSRELTTSTLAKTQGVSVGYLSSVFRRETGKTLTEFIRIRRMDHARYLLRSTTLQVQSVAMHCGIVDLQYFSKLFKRHTGKTPSEYRAALIKNS